jgi:hypothetical protein
MKRICSLLLCLGLAQCANATILFYKQNLAVGITGTGRVMNRTFSGFTLIDSASSDLAFISADVRSKRFKVEQPDHTLVNVQAPGNGTRTLLRITSGDGAGLIGRGVSTWLNVGASQPVLSPATFAVGGCDGYVPSGLTNAFIFEYRGAIVYDKTDTVAAMRANADMAAAIEQARAIMNSKGYTEE